ncbi:hypothetical protein HY357_02580 [Candidatus Roizmanbacteria bacterium]|nr:hypothetical protein [Candidatus Roizmanbacteria bacterium]
MSFKFPYQFRLVDNLKIPYPIVTIYLETIRGRRAFSFIMDTGADSMTLPYYMITLLGIKKESLIGSESQGIGKELVKTWEGKININFCERQFAIHCSFTDNNKTPLLLGKEDIFAKFNVVFDNDKQQTIFAERKQ